MRHIVVLPALIAAGLAIGASEAPAQTLRGSPASVDLMYTAAHTSDLLFLRTPADVYAAAMSGALRLVSITDDLDLGKVAYPFVLPNTLQFADSLAAAYHAGCGERLVMTSGARPVDEQPRNASPKSVHPTGMAIDFRRPKTAACLTWLRKNLVSLEDRHVVEATEERHPPHFHVAVLRQAPERQITVAAGEINVPKRARGAVRSRHSSRANGTRRTHAKRSTRAAKKPR